jgi:predicted RNA binding protein YcfA (HicA-like mRNA interferase family)
MTRLPALAAREVVRAFGRAGFEFQRQTGSHLILYSAQRHQALSVPNHDPVKRGTLRALIRQAGLTAEQFLSLLR